MRRYHPFVIGKWARHHDLKWTDLEDDDSLFGESPPAEVKVQFLEGWHEADDELLEEKVKELKATLLSIHLPEGKQGRHTGDGYGHKNSMGSEGTVAADAVTTDVADVRHERVGRDG